MNITRVKTINDKIWLRIVIVCSILLYLLYGYLMGYELSRSFWAFLLLAAGELICASIIVLEKTINKNIKIIKKFVLCVEAVVLFVFVLMSCVYFALFCIINEEQDSFETKCIDIPYKAEYVVILGSQLKDGQMDNHLLERLDYYCKIADGYEVETKNVILSGGATEDGYAITEAQLMMEYLIEKGINPNIILSEPQSTTTYENIRNISRYYKGKQTIIISSDYHLPRIWLITREMNMNECILLGCERGIKGKSYHCFEEIFGIIAFFLNIR